MLQGLQTPAAIRERVENVAQQQSDDDADEEGAWSDSNDDAEFEVSPAACHPVWHVFGKLHACCQHYCCCSSLTLCADWLLLARNELMQADAPVRMLGHMNKACSLHIC